MQYISVQNTRELPFRKLNAESQNVAENENKFVRSNFHKKIFTKKPGFVTD